MKYFLLVILGFILNSVSPKLESGWGADTDGDGDPDSWKRDSSVTGRTTVYDVKEKEKWIYYDTRDLNKTELAAREKMWKIHLNVTKGRGFMTGFHRGFYKNYTYEMHPECFGRDAVKYLYYIDWEFSHFNSFSDFL